MRRALEPEHTVLGLVKTLLEHAILGQARRRPGQGAWRLIEPDEVAATVAFVLGPDGRAFSAVPVIMDQDWSAK